LSHAVRQALREKGTPFQDLGLGDETLTDEQLLDAMMAHLDHPKSCCRFCRNPNKATSPRRTAKW
jgi:arsenate reductase-like glutaredoxin family protein